MNRPSLTLAIPFHREPRLLARALASAARQTDAAWELLVSDDGGADSGAEAIVRSFRDPRMRYLRRAGQPGMAANWNHCLDASHTELVSLLHADDELEPGYVALMREAASQFPEALAIFCKARIIDASGRPIFSFPDWIKRWLVPSRGRRFLVQGQAGLTSLLRGNYIMCPTLCYRKSRLGGRRFATRWRMVLDLDFLCSSLLDGEILVGVNEMGYAYRRHDASETAAHTRSLLRFAEESALYDRIAARASSLGWRAARDVARRKTILKLHLAHRAACELFEAPSRVPPSARCLLALLRTGTLPRDVAGQHAAVVLPNAA